MKGYHLAAFHDVRYYSNYVMTLSRPFLPLSSGEGRGEVFYLFNANATLTFATCPRSRVDPPKGGSTLTC